MTVKELRTRTGLSQSKFCQRFHLQLGTLRTWEQGTRNCPDPILYLIAEVLDLEARLKEDRDENSNRRMERDG